MAVRMHKVLPYVIVLAIVSYLYFLAAKMDFVAPGGRIGPDFWPKVILAMAMVACAYEIVKNLFFGKADRGVQIAPSLVPGRFRRRVNLRGGQEKHLCQRGSFASITIMW